jgi:SnoaL-like domain
MAVSAEDRFSILELLAQYNWSIDNRLPNAADTWADVFTPDGQFTVWIDPAIGVPAGADGGVKQSVSVSGRDQLRAYAEKAQQARARSGFHYVDNVMISGDGERATLQCYLRSVLAQTDAENERVMGNGYYRDELRKVDGEWKFERRDLFVSLATAKRVAV